MTPAIEAFGRAMALAAPLLATGVGTFADVAVGSLFAARRRERRLWNGGVCAETGEPWELVSTTLHGARVYRSGRYRATIALQGIEAAPASVRLVIRRAVVVALLRWALRMSPIEDTSVRLRLTLALRAAAK